MCAYNKLNGVYASEHSWLLTDVLRNDWGFDGLVVSDWGAVHDRVAALAAGLDLEMPPNLGVSDSAIVAAVRDGGLAEAILDTAVLRVLRLVGRATEAQRIPSISVDADAHHELARVAAVESAVLLKNDDDLLPLEPVDGDVVAVIGEFARTPRYQGAGSSQVNPTRLDVPLDAIRAAVPDGVEVTFAPGFGIGTTDDDETFAAEALALAREATYVVAFLGLPAVDESEGFDREHLNLPHNQVALLGRLRAVNPNIAVVLANGAVVSLAGWRDQVRSILECWLAGQAGAGAVADLLLGTANPSGRLAETVPMRLQDNPSYLNFPGEAGHVRYGEGIFVGYRGYDAVGRDVCYPFGHGLSYTTFEYANLATTVAGHVEDDSLAISVTFDVANTGDRHGAEVAQLYVGDPVAQVARPVRELKAFEKVRLDPGASTTVTFTLTARDLSYWSSAHRRWVVEAGAFELAVGASSRDLRLITTVDVESPAIPHRLDSMATLKEWLADPNGSAALHEAVGVGPDGRPRGILGDQRLISIIGNFPLSSLAAFGDLGIDHAIVTRLTTQTRATSSR
jgi:beta-glucosidase